MTEADVIALVSGLPGVAAVRASEDNGAPRVAWGDSFFFYDPDDRPENRRMPFATVVMHDCDGFDTASALNRPGVFRLNLAVGRERFEEVVGWAPAEYAARSAGVDYAVLDTVVPHPVYAAQGWVSIVCPRTASQVRELLEHAHARAVRAWRPRAGGQVRAVTTKHPAADERGRFDELAEGASNFTSSPTFFVLCLALVAAWAASFAAGNTAHHVAGTSWPP
jgi:Family of unknown function (DUF6194)